MIILGISAFYHDSAAAIIRDGAIVAAAQEERFTRIKHDASFPRLALTYCLKEAGISGKDVDRVVYYEKPFIKFNRLIETYLAFAPRGFSFFLKSMPSWLSDKLFMREILYEELKKTDEALSEKKKLLFSEHHFSHAASAFFPSPFDRAAILTMDGVGEWATTSLSLGCGNNLYIEREIHFPHSLGLLYSAFTYFCGFKVNSGEYKLMGLAPYGMPRYTSLIFNNLIDVKSDGSFRLNMEYFTYCNNLKMTGRKFQDLFGVTPRDPQKNIENIYIDIAASIQAVTEEIIVRLARSIAKETGEKNICLAGGVALNCVANGKLLQENLFEGLFIPPAAGDAGGAIGAAYAAYYLHEKRPRLFPENSDAMQGAFLGPSYSQEEIENTLKKIGAFFSVVDDDELLETTAKTLASGLSVGWRQGRLEFGPRSLGGSSILADPRSPMMQKILNQKIKYRESFRPFAPSILKERASKWFELDQESPYMLLVAKVKSEHRKPTSELEESLSGIEKMRVVRSTIPAVTHVDYSARVQTVSKDTNPRYYNLISKFEKLTGCPVLVNTSFNVRGEPIVDSPEDVFRCFMGTDLDFLAIGNCILWKKDQDAKLKVIYHSELEPD